ncbi:cyclic nucleotide-binding domain-containing protein [Eubacteriales bacterium OttesenSCG-928-A19]|nr:cyclic nucleotide-binding domain-containing protein [Eubacteriales bacterium OttesenSCG-928-A19]
MRKEVLSAGRAQWIERYGLGDLPMESMYLFQYEKGEYLCRAGETIPNLLLITEGKVRVSITGFNGKSLLYCINVNRGILGSIELLSGAPATASGLALTPVTCIAVPIAENIDRLRGSLAFMNCLCRELSTVFESSSRNSALNILYPLETRLCSYIAITQENGRFEERLVDVHELLGSSYRHLLRTLDALCVKGVLDRGKRGYVVADQERLEQIAQGYYG